MKAFKKLISLFLAVIMLLSLVGCRQQAAGSGETTESVSLDNSGGTSDPSDPSDPSTPSAPVDPSDPSEPVDPSDPSDPVDPSTPSEPDEGGDQTGDDTDKDKEEEKEDEDDEILTAPTSLDGLEIVKEAVKYLGTPYVYGGNSLTNGIDCSGFTKQIYKKFGITLPRTAAAQSKLGTRVSLADAKPGDLFAEAYEDQSNYTGHAGIYIGNGWIIGAEPGAGVCCTFYGETEGDYTFIRLLENTYSGTGAEAIQTLEKQLIASGQYGRINSISATYYADTKEFICKANSPLIGKGGDFHEPSLALDLLNPPEGYEDLAEVWCEKYMEGAMPFLVRGYDKQWRYFNGEWLVWPGYGRWAGEIFYGCIWDESQIVTDAGEVVDFSTFPENYTPT